MNTNNIHPELKKALATEMQRQAPLGLHARIMKQVFAAHAQQLAAPSATPWVVLALLFAAAMIVLPLLAVNPLANVQLPALTFPDLRMSTPILLSVLGLICLYALNEMPHLKPNRKQA